MYIYTNENDASPVRYKYIYKYNISFSLIFCEI